MILLIGMFWEDEPLEIPDFSACLESCLPKDIVADLKNWWIFQEGIRA